MLGARHRRNFLVGMRDKLRWSAIRSTQEIRQGGAQGALIEWLSQDWSIAAPIGTGRIVSARKNERDALGSDLLRYWVAPATPKVHIEDRGIDVLCLEQFESALQIERWANNVEAQIGQHVVEKHCHQGLVLYDEYSFAAVVWHRLCSSLP